MKNIDFYREKAADILSKMTLDEKIAQMNLYIIDDLYNKIVNGEEPEIVGSVFALGNDIAKKAKVLQEYAMSREHKIPYLIGADAIRCSTDVNSTVFPQTAGLAGTFDRELIKDIAEVIGKECKILGITHNYAPDLDIAKEPRWGRIQETYGEDPYLIGEMGAVYVKGFQENGVAATVKHYLGYFAPEGGINLAPVHMGERELREIALDPFEKCLKAGALTVMPAYNEVDGEPLHASKKYLRDILRTELGFDGVIISDYGAVDMLSNFHHIANGSFEAGKLALEAGVDIESPGPFGYGKALKEAVLKGEVSEKLVDEAVMRILLLKFRLGLFDSPCPLDEKMDTLHSKDSVALELKAEEDSILLLKNDGILPLDENKIGNVAVIGPNAKSFALGDFVVANNYCVSFYNGIYKRLGADRVNYALGCNYISGSDEDLNEAIAQAKCSDLVFLVLGDNDGVSGGFAGVGETKDEVTCGEGYDRSDLCLTKSQKRLFEEIVKLNKPTVLIMYGGRPFTIGDEIDRTNACMFSFGAGEQNGIAFANLIFGDKSPSAKLCMSFPKSVGHLPCNYNYKVSARGRFYKKHGSYEKPGRDYVLSSPDALFPFGYGLSYTELEYKNLCATKTGDSVSVSVEVKNTGKYAIDESVLVFVSAESCPVTPFIKQLKEFKKVHLEPNECKKVEFVLSTDAFTYIDLDYKKAINHGKHTVMVGKLSLDVYY